MSIVDRNIERDLMTRISMVRRMLGQSGLEAGEVRQAIERAIDCAEDAFRNPSLETRDAAQEARDAAELTMPDYGLVYAAVNLAEAAVCWVAASSDACEPIRLALFNDAVSLASSAARSAESSVVARARMRAGKD